MSETAGHLRFCAKRSDQIIRTTHANAHHLGHYHTKHCHAAAASLAVD